MGRSARSTSTEANDGTAHCEERSPLPRPLPRMRRIGGHTAGPHRTRLTPGGRRGRLSQPYCASLVPGTSAGKLGSKLLEPEGCEECCPAGRREGVLTSRRHARLCSDEQVFQLRNNLKRWASPVTLYPQQTICCLAHGRGVVGVSRPFFPDRRTGLPVMHRTGLVRRRSEACRVRRDSDRNVPCSALLGI
jgi:hypothetical protein